MPFGKSAIRREGRDVVVITYGAVVQRALLAAQQAEKDGISAMVIDLRTIAPFDWDGIATAVKRTSRVVVAHEDQLTCGFGAELAARISEHLFEHLDAPVKRVAAKDVAGRLLPGSRRGHPAAGGRRAEGDPRSRAVLTRARVTIVMRLLPLALLAACPRRECRRGARRGRSKPSPPSADCPPTSPDSSPSCRPVSRLPTASTSSSIAAATRSTRCRRPYETARVLVQIGAEPGRLLSPSAFDLGDGRPVRRRRHAEPARPHPAVPRERPRVGGFTLATRDTPTMVVDNWLQSGLVSLGIHRPFGDRQPAGAGVADVGVLAGRQRFTHHRRAAADRAGRRTATSTWR